VFPVSLSKVWVILIMSACEGNGKIRTLEVSVKILEISVRIFAILVVGKLQNPTGTSSVPFFTILYMVLTTEILDLG